MIVVFVRDIEKGDVLSAAHRPSLSSWGGVSLCRRPRFRERAGRSRYVLAQCRP